MLLDPATDVIAINVCATKTRCMAVNASDHQ